MAPPSFASLLQTCAQKAEGFFLQNLKPLAGQPFSDTHMYLLTRLEVAPRIGNFLYQI